MKTVERWEKLEDYVVEFFKKRWPKLHRTKRSGGIDGSGDMQAFSGSKKMPSPFPLHVDCKFRDNNSPSCTLNEYDKAKGELAFGSHKIPVIVRELANGRKFAILEFEDFAELVIERDQYMNPDEE